MESVSRKYPVLHGQQAVALVPHSLDPAAFLFKLLHRLPDRRPGHAKLTAEGLSGHIAAVFL